MRDASVCKGCACFHSGKRLVITTKMNGTEISRRMADFYDCKYDSKAYYDEEYLPMKVPDDCVYFLEHAIATQQGVA